MEDRYPTKAANCENCKHENTDCLGRWREMNGITTKENLYEHGEKINCWEGR